MTTFTMQQDICSNIRKYKSDFLLSPVWNMCGKDVLYNMVKTKMREALLNYGDLHSNDLDFS